MVSVVKHIRRLDFTRSTQGFKGLVVPKSGIRSHGAVSLANLLPAITYLTVLDKLQLWRARTSKPGGGTW